MDLDFRTLFRSSPSLYMVLAPDERWTILDANDAYLAATMTQRDAIAGRGLFDVFPDNPDDPSADGTRNLAESLARAVATRAPDTMAIQKYDVRRPDGTFEERWWAPINVPIVEGNVVRYILHRAEDVTELARARQHGVALAARVEAEEKRADLRFRDLVDLAPDGVIVCDAKGTVLVVNVAAERMFGYSRTELIGQPLEVLVPERARARHAVHLAGFAAAPTSRAMGTGLVLAGRRKDASEFPIEISLSPMRTGSTLTILAAVRDTTERMRLEEATRRTSSYLASAVQSVQGAFALYDEHDRLVLANTEYCELYRSGATLPSAGQTFTEILDASLRANRHATTATAEEVRTRVLENHRTAGTLQITGLSGRTYRIFEQRTAEGGTVSLLVDITADVLLADELRAARTTAEAASVAKSDFLSSMSHELRTPLNAILGFTELMQRDRKEPATVRQRERLDHVHRGGEHLLRLINEILDLSRIESGNASISLETVDVGQVIDDVISQLQPVAAQHEITFARAEHTPPGMVIADRTRLSQILMNFGSNAIKYGRPKGHATVHATRMRDARIRVTIVDDGIGIPADKQATIFEPFQRAGQEAGPIEGTGIGLAISKRLAETMGGTVGFTSEPGRGSEFWLELPEPDPEAPLPPRSSPRKSALAGSGSPFRVVYIEDNPANIALVEALAAELPRIELVSALDAEQGLARIHEQRPALVLMDINLSGMSGIDAMRALAADPRTQTIPVIALSADPQSRDTARERGVEFTRYLHKPIDLDALTLALEELLIGPVVEH